MVFYRQGCNFKSNSLTNNICELGVRIINQWPMIFAPLIKIKARLALNNLIRQKKKLPYPDSSASILRQSQAIVPRSEDQLIRNYSDRSQELTGTRPLVEYLATIIYSVKFDDPTDSTAFQKPNPKTIFLRLFGLMSIIRHANYKLNLKVKK